MIGSPGPANMLLVSSGLKFGFRNSIPFVFGIVLSKQFIIWPIVLGIVNLSNLHESIYIIMKYVAAAYIVFLAVKMYNMKIIRNLADEKPPSFSQGLVVHPLNPKAWLMISTASATFMPRDMSPIEAALILSPTFLIIQLVLHPIWCYFGSWIAKKISGSIFEKLFLFIIMFLTFLSVFLIIVFE